MENLKTHIQRSQRRKQRAAGSSRSLSLSAEMAPLRAMAACDAPRTNWCTMLAVGGGSTESATRRAACTVPGRDNTSERVSRGTEALARRRARREGETEEEE